MTHKIPLNNCLARETIGPNYDVVLLDEQLDTSVLHTKNVLDFENSFIYSVLKINPPNTVIFCERGIGKFFKRDNNILLNRLRPISHYIEGVTEVCGIHTKPFDLSTERNEIISLSIEPPITQSELTSFPNSILHSDDEGMLDSTTMLNDHVLGMFHNEISPIRISDISKARCYNDVNEAPKTKGLIIYDESSDCLKYYSGKSWRKI